MVFGSKYKFLGSELVFDKCLNCERTNSILLNFFQKYAHFYWIPFFPMAKSGASTCLNCKQSLELSEMPGGLRITFENLKGGYSTPIWTFSGSILLFIIMVWVAGQNKLIKSRTDAYLANPKIGDIYEVKLDKEEYSLSVVTRIDDSSVYFQMSNYLASSKDGLKSPRMIAFTADSFRVSKSRLSELKKSGFILGVRKR